MTRLLRGSLHDFRYALRGARRHPGIAVIAVLSLALGIGGSTSIFYLLDALLIRSLPVAHPDALVVLVRDDPSRGTADYVTYPTFERFRDSGLFASVTASMVTERAGVTFDRDPAPSATPLRLGLVSGSYFSTLGVDAAIGRTLTDSDSAPVAVISDALRRRQFAPEENPIGRSFTLNGTTYAIVGVAGGGFTGENLGAATDAWVPIAMQSRVMTERPGLLQNSASNWIRALARLRPEMSMGQTEAAARPVFAAMGVAPAAVRLDLVPAGRGFSYLRETLTAPLQFLGVIVGVVLLIACANVAMLVMARAAGRQKEIALRLALGASRWRLARQSLADSLVLAALAGAAGLVVSLWATHGLIALAGSGRAAFHLDVGVDARMTVLVVAATLVTTMLIGIVPAIRAARAKISPAAMASGAGGRLITSTRLAGGRVLVIGQIAASVALVIAGGLFVRTLRNLERQDVGFDRDRVWMFWMSPMQAGRTGTALAPLFASAPERARAIPGVKSASVSSDGVLSGFIGLRAVAVEGDASPQSGSETAQWNLVDSSFFDTIGMRIVAGRGLSDRDNAAAPAVAVVNESMARRFFHGENALGKRFGFGRDLSRRIEVVGVVRDAKYFSARDSDVPMVFLPYQQDAANLFRMCVVVRLAADTPSLVPQIREALQQIDSAVPVSSVNTTSDQLDRTLSNERLVAWLASAFGVLALVLAATGLYGVMSYLVARRTPEIGVRVALGQPRGSVLWLVLRGSLLLAAAGLVLGIPAALLAAQWARALLFGVTPADPWTLGLTVLLVGAVTVMATIVPARRAARIDPIVALRAD